MELVVAGECTCTYYIYVALGSGRLILLPGTWSKSVRSGAAAMANVRLPGAEGAQRGLGSRPRRRRCAAPESCKARAGSCRSPLNRLLEGKRGPRVKQIRLERILYDEKIMVLEMKVELCVSFLWDIFNLQVILSSGAHANDRDCTREASWRPVEYIYARCTFRVCGFGIEYWSNSNYLNIRAVRSANIYAAVRSNSLELNLTLVTEYIFAL